MPGWTPLRPGPWDAPAPHVQGHRGARGEVVENTLASFERAARAGAAGIELDVLLTADGVPVVWHDPVLEAHRCAAPAELYGRRVDELTLAELARVDAGSVRDPRHPDQVLRPGTPVVTLEQVLHDLGGRHPDLWWTVEVKVDATDPRDVARRAQLVDATVRVIHDAGAARRAVVHSFDWAVLDLARELDDTLPRSALIQLGETDVVGGPWTGPVDLRDHDGDVVAAAAALGAHAIAPGIQHAGVVGVETYRTGAGATPVTRELVDRAHALGLAVVPWTVNRPQDVTEVVAAGVDGLMTDYPTRVLADLAR